MVAVIMMMMMLVEEVVIEAMHSFARALRYRIRGSASKHGAYYALNYYFLDEKNRVVKAILAGTSIHAIHWAQLRASKPSDHDVT